MNVISVFLCLYMLSVLGNAAEVRALSWETLHAAPPVKLNEKEQSLLPLIRFSISSLPEPQVMKLAFLGGKYLGLDDDNAKDLNRMLASQYKEIKANTIFSNVSSALPYCFSVKKPQKGKAFVYVPDGVHKDSKVIIFLHGYGGSFIFYQHYLATVFPDHIIICPAYGVSSAFIPSAYLQETVDATSTELGFKIRRPVLLGLSAGGFGGFREYVRRPAFYLGYICLAAFPPDGIVTQLPSDGKIRIVAGGDESFVKNGKLRRSVIKLRGKLKDCQSKLIPGHGHFFMLSAEEETKVILKMWNKELQEE